MMENRKWLVGAVGAVLIAAGAWALGLVGGGDPAVAELQQLSAQMFDRDLPDAQREQLRHDFRDRIQSLSEDQRRAFFDANRDQWMARAERRMDEFFALAPAEQRRQLDDLLDRMQQPRADRPRDAGQGRRGQGRGGWANMTEAQRDERSKRRLDRTSPRVRAQFTEFRRRLNERARERGIDPDTLRGRGFPGRRGV